MKKFILLILMISSLFGSWFVESTSESRVKLLSKTYTTTVGVIYIVCIDEYQYVLIPNDITQMFKIGNNGTSLPINCKGK
jgi:hypothetical protein